MATTLRWFKIDPFSNKDLKRLSEGLLSEQYNDERGWGFQLVDVRKDYIAGRYIIKEKHVESFRNPKGDIQTVEYLTFRETEFRVQNLLPHIEIQSPTRGVTEMFNRFGNALNFEVSIVALAIEPIQWVKHLKKDFELVSIQRAVISDIELSPNVAATVTIAGTEDVQKYFKEIIKNRKFSLDSALISFMDNGVEIKIEASRSGRLKVITANSDFSNSFFRACVPKLI